MRSGRCVLWHVHSALKGELFPVEHDAGHYHIQNEFDTPFQGFTRLVIRRRKIIDSVGPGELAANRQGLRIAPLIDVVFLLLIFFMVSTMFTKESHLKLNLPEAAGT